MSSINNPNEGIFDPSIYDRYVDLRKLGKKIYQELKPNPNPRIREPEPIPENYKPKPYGEKKTYPQNWPVYYAACRSEKLMVFRIINDSIEDLDIPENQVTNGRPRADQKDILKALSIMAYCGLSMWRIESELRIAKALGILKKVYKRSALSKYLGKPEITEYLHQVYKKIAEPIGVVETQLAADATGISVSYGRKRWVEVRDQFQEHTDYKKLHAVCGCKTNIIFAAEITVGTAHDSPPFKELINTTTEYIQAKEISADPAYLSRKNVDHIASKGLLPYILPKKNVRTLNKGSDGTWGRMIRLWKEHQDIFALHYHQRSNVESTFGMLKRKFGYHTRAKNEVAQTNEILTKIVCLNAAILGEAILEFNMQPHFMDT